MASQISNLAGYGPTDCPTREKHWWLGDAQDTAEEAMYNFFTPGVHELFAHEMRASQDANASSEFQGFVRGVVPARTNGPPSKGNKSDPFPGDISWTAAYPLTVGWLHQYFGDAQVIEEHWSALKLYLPAYLPAYLPTCCCCCCCCCCCFSHEQNPYLPVQTSLNFGLGFTIRFECLCTSRTH